ncbi:MAG: hypothetical protein RIR76_1896 [Verrucomicrobiota bacterium]|jgi:hypothetical protein|nr:FecR family protein [Opitutaceae bacterium]
MSPDEIDTLIERHLDGLATPEEVRALSQRIEQDSAARQLYLRKARLHAALGAAETQPSEDRTEFNSVPSLPRPRPLAWAASIAGLTTLSLLLWRLLIAPGWEARAAPVATLREISDARWVTPEARFAPGDTLRAGQTLELSAGSAALEFTSGARVTLMGPSIFELTSDKSGFLTLGRLKAEATTPASKGFTVRTRTARVVDIGTQFIAAAAPDGQSRIDVTDGEVHVLLDGSTTAHRLRTGEAMSVEAGSAQVLVRIEPGDGTAAFRFPTIPPPSRDDIADRSRGLATMKVVRGELFLRAPIPSGPPELLLDGNGQNAPDSPRESVFFGPNDSGALLLDLGQPVTISQITTYSWHQSRAAHNRVRAVQKFTLYGFNGDSPPSIETGTSRTGWVPIARVDSDDFFRVMQPVDRPAQQACLIAGANGLIGRYRFLLWEVEPTQSVSQPVLDNTFYAEFDVHGNP